MFESFYVLCIGMKQLHILHIEKLKQFPRTLSPSLHSIQRYIWVTLVDEFRETRYGNRSRRIEARTPQHQIAFTAHMSLSQST